MAEDRIARLDVFLTDQSAEHGLLLLATHQSHAAALENHVPIGQHLRHTDRDPGGDALGIVDCTASLEAFVGLHVHGRILAATGQKSVLARAEQEARDTRTNARLFGGFSVVLLGRFVGLFDHDGEDVADITGTIVGQEQTSRGLDPQRPVGGQHRHRYHGHDGHGGRYRERVDREERASELGKLIHGDRGFLDRLHRGIRTESSP